jgi:hypothetical protein
MKSVLTRNIVVSLIITFAILGTVWYSVVYLNNQRVAQLDSIENQLSIDTLSVETQYALLADAPCEDLTQGSTTEDTSLSQEVSNLGDKLSYAEGKLGEKDPEVIQLKDQYTLLEIRDYLLAQQISTSCHISPTTVLYFYSNNDPDCQDECDRASYALSYLHQTYPALRVYSFDYNLDLPALETLESIEKVKAQFPAFVINHKQYYGFTSLDDFEKDFPPNLFATTTATSTATTTTK